MWFMFFHLFIRLSSDVAPVVDSKMQTKHETSYRIQNVRYIFQIMTDAAAVRCVLISYLCTIKTTYLLIDVLTPELSSVF